MLLHFIKLWCLSIWSRYMQIRFQILPLILVVDYFEVSSATVSSATAEYSSFASASSSSIYSSFIYFPQYICIYIEWKSIILVICSCIFSLRRLRLFIHDDFFFFVFPVSSFSSCLFCEFLWLVFLLILWIVVTRFLFVLNYRLYCYHWSL